ncbi:MAG: hypothetical protein PVI90_03115 [Desulfobacteraceae bacterium]|jgi:hypothetical protein
MIYKFLITYFVVFFILWSPIVYANESNDVAKNLKIIPPWTLRLCPNDTYATYDIDGAKKLKETDAYCVLLQTKTTLLEAKKEGYTSTIKNLRNIIDTYKEEQAFNQQRIKELFDRCNKEIAEKNKYKYKTNYSGLYIAIGAALALVGISFGVGVFIAKK